LIEFGRQAANRRRGGLGKPETFTTFFAIKYRP
jgi:hypothetical protein